MGCAGSKVEELPAVVLCRERCTFLEEAIRHRSQLADSHFSYFHSLTSVAHSSLLSPPPHLSTYKHPPPNHSSDAKPPSAGHLVFDSHSRSHSGSHIRFDSDDDDSDDDDDISHLHLHHHDSPSDPFPAYGEGRGGMYYMKSSKTTPSVVYQQRPAAYESVLHYGGPSSSYPNPYPYTNPPLPPPDDRYPNPNASYYGYSSQPAPQPPPPPSPPKASSWDFLNPFENYERFYPTYVTNTPSRDSKELREEEGIPDLEDDNGYHHRHQNDVVIKEVLQPGPSRYHPDNGDDVGGGRGEAAMGEDDVGIAGGGGGVEYEVHVVDKKVVGGGDEDGNTNYNYNYTRPKDGTEVAFEIKAQFERASASGDEVAKLLEVGAHPHQPTRVSKLLHGVTPPLPVVSSQPSASKASGDTSSAAADKTNQLLLEIHKELAIKSKNLSSTLHKLHILEKKLFVEVKAEEKMRVAHEKNCRKLKSLDERGAEPHKVDATRTLIRSLSTKMRMAIQVVDSISVTINKTRDEELWPQLYELIQGLMRMWKSMLECHHRQCEALREARSLGPIGTSKQLGDAHLDAGRHLVNWTSSFSSWIVAQKGFVSALNNWLFRCLLYEPEDTPDGPVPFSPGRLGAPLVFVICHQWAQAMDRISEKEVIEAMSTLTMSVLHLCERDNGEMHQRMVTNKDLERKVRNVDREDQKVQKEIQALEKQIVRVAGDINSLSETSNMVLQSDVSKNLLGNLLRIFEAMERFTSDNMKVYEELVQRTEEERRRALGA